MGSDVRSGDVLRLELTTSIRKAEAKDKGRSAKGHQIQARVYRSKLSHAGAGKKFGN